ncbi:hypothetical protein TBLA_0E00800 [Henningerozyma blattae CBS 6284]|uniref:DNA polymerase epsilon subunit B n=1 Tax=Henningerozyma blattae (strain ATCC 34711 / CBS 6284 / DSM 70876 / NBRC 10599 / NRRL Y-10934 / UCD 77-7) TaxID=1071380 RepID=I2H439_HENB6|nr:hypothetical protein TBLA_0E00800 [Tetrapisispora blattae CBS 6284]CCH61141.1 hypothetical protein TBLA_0E00800 [Tetrapisispora blattae CBS 6284]
MFNSSTVLPAKVPPNLVRPLAYRILSKKHGLNIKSNGLNELSKNIGIYFGMDWKRNPKMFEFLEIFAQVWKEQERGLFVDDVGVKGVITEMKEREKVELNRLDVQKNSRQKNVLNMLDLGPRGNDMDIDQDDNEMPLQNTSLPSLPIDMDSQDTINITQEPQESQESREPIQSLEDQATELDWQDYFKLIGAWDQQKFTYDPIKSQFRYSQSQKKKILPNIEDKLNLFKTRYNLTKDRVLRNEDFQNVDTFNPLSSIVAMNNELNQQSTNAIDNNVSITPIKNLIGQDGRNFLIMGMIYKSPRGRWCMEDASGSIEINISQTIPTDGTYYVPGCIVIAEGIYFSAGDTFHVTSMTQPPGEKRLNTLEAIGNLDLLGVHGQSNVNYISRLDNELKIRLHYLERELTDNIFVILGGDLFLDELKTFDALKKIFEKLNEDPPIVLILLGSFSQKPIFATMNNHRISSSEQYKNNFDTLATLLTQFENLIATTTFIFIPGVNDPWGSSVSLGSSTTLPQRNIPEEYQSKINRICKKTYWGTNPMRLAYLSQEIIIMRDDLRDRFKRHNIEFPIVVEKQIKEQELSIDKSDDDIPIDKLPSHLKESRKIVKTLLDQGHLSPFLMNIRPIVWDLDFCLNMYPIPSLLILSDSSCDKFDVTYNGCKVINSGTFINNRRARYIEYSPSLRRSIEQEINF